MNLRNYRWIVSDPEIFGGKPIVKGSRFTVSFILSCLAEGMTADDIDSTYAPFPHEAVSEILKFTSELTDTPDVAA